MVYRSRPPEIEAAEVLHHLAALRHHPLQVRAICASTLETEVGLLAAARGGRTCVAKEAARNPRHSVVTRVAPEVVAQERHRECDTATLRPVEQALALQPCDQRLDPVVGQVQQLQEGLD